MPSPGLSPTFGAQEQWSDALIEALILESALAARRRQPRRERQPTSFTCRG